MRLRNLKSSDIRQVNGFIRKAAGLTSIEELEALFIDEISRILPNDCPVWNNQSLDFFTILSVTMEKDYEIEGLSRLDALYAHFDEHPGLAALGGYGPSWSRPMHMSEFISDVQLIENPLYRGLYRHIDSKYQVAMHVATLSDRQVVISLNNGRMDFDPNFVQKFHYFVLGIRRVVAALDQTRILEERLDALAGVLGGMSEVHGLDALTPSEVRALSSLFQQPTLITAAEQANLSIRTMDERVAGIREKLGLDNTAQLRVALQDMRAGGGRLG